MYHSAIFSLLLSTLIWTADAKSGKKSPCLDTKAVPTLTLPWGTYEGKPYGDDGETILFSNIRFAKPPVGDLRFAAPQYPDAIPDNSQIQDSSFGPNCIQAAAENNHRSIFDTVPEPPANETTQSEDCLFLDVYVPSWVLEPDSPKLPVVVWIFGGAYIFGGKNTTFPIDGSVPYNAYDGAGVRHFTDGGVIWVTGNYRLGAYGFLAGETMEQNAQPNAGLHDQRLLLDWVQKYIGQVGGDTSQVNVWGLSAGAGSILHHLTAYGGTKKDEKPLFQRASLWSPAFQWSFDRRGTLQDTFYAFVSAANCEDTKDDLQCLRKASNETLRRANQQVISDKLDQGMFPFGPAVDGDLVPDLPANLLKQGKHLGIESMMLAHDYNEAQIFLADWVKTETDFSQFVEYAFPGRALIKVRQDILSQYPSSAYSDQQERLRILLRDSTFVCNNYQLYTAFQTSSRIYSSRYEIPPALHGSELLLLIWNREARFSDLIQALLPNVERYVMDILGLILPSIASTYHRYLAGHALSGDPNFLSGRTGVEWGVTGSDGEGLTDVLRVGIQYLNSRFFYSGPDSQVSSKNCEFWDEVAEKIVRLVGAGGDGVVVGVERQSDGAWRVEEQIEL